MQNQDFATPNTNGASASPSHMTAGERRDLLRLVKQREVLLIKEVEERSARLTADFEKQLTDKFLLPANVEAKMETIVNEEITIAVTRINDRCKQAGVPTHFLERARVSGNVISNPSDFSYDWGKAGKLRKAALAEINAQEKAALTAVKREGLNLQAEIVAHGLGSATALAFLERFSSAEQLMAPVDLIQIEGKTIN
jgi:hypothetical protein